MFFIKVPPSQCTVWCTVLVTATEYICLTSKCFYSMANLQHVLLPPAFEPAFDVHKH